MPLGTKVGLGPGRIVLHGDPAPPNGAQRPRQFSVFFIVVKRSPISVTAEHLFVDFIALHVARSVKTVEEDEEEEDSRAGSQSHQSHLYLRTVSKLQNIKLFHCPTVLAVSY